VFTLESFAKVFPVVSGLLMVYHVPLQCSLLYYSGEGRGALEGTSLGDWPVLQKRAVRIVAGDKPKEISSCDAVLCLYKGALSMRTIPSWRTEVGWSLVTRCAAVIYILYCSFNGIAFSLLTKLVYFVNCFSEYKTSWYLQELEDL